MPEEKEKEKPKQGDILAYTKEIDRFVVDEKGNQIPVSDNVHAKILSLLLEIKQLLKKEDQS